MNETVNTAIKQKFWAFVRSRLWWQQFRDLVLKCVVYMKWRPSYSGSCVSIVTPTEANRGVDSESETR